MHVFPRRCDPLVDICTRNAQTQLRSVMRYINGWKEMLEGKKNISGIHQGFFYMRQLHGDNYAIVDAIFFAL